MDTIKKTCIKCEEEFDGLYDENKYCDECREYVDNQITLNNKNMKPKTIKIDEVEYIQKDGYKPAQQLDGLDYCIIRTYSAGCFAGYVKEREGQEATIINARRLWYWDGAASLSQLAMEGVKNPDNCKFAMEVGEIILTNVIEVIKATEEARENISNVKIWKK